MIAEPRVVGDLVAYLPLVRTLAARHKRHVPRRVLFDDLVSEGTRGVLDAWQRFVPDRGVPFEAFVRRRINGAMLDYMRRESTNSRSAYKRARAGLEPLLTVVSLDSRTTRDGGEQQRLTDQLVDPQGIDPETRLGDLERATWFRARLRVGWRRLSPRARRILIARYCHGRTLVSIGRDHGVGESAISLITKSALRTLRATLTEAG